MKTYREKIEHFRQRFEQQHNERLRALYPDAKFEPVGVEEGYKFVRVFIIRNDQKIGRFMVGKQPSLTQQRGAGPEPEVIYGIKTWAQYNKRRRYGTLDTVDQYEWGIEPPYPIPGTQADKAHELWETAQRAKRKKIGRPSRMSRVADILRQSPSADPLYGPLVEVPEK